MTRFRFPRPFRWWFEVIALVVLIAYPLMPVLDWLLESQKIPVRVDKALVPIFIFAILSLGLNLQVGYAGLLQLGIAAFFAIGAYTAGVMTVEKYPFQLGFWGALVAGPVVAGMAGMALGAPTLRLKGDYLAIVTLGFGEIIRIFLNNLSRPVNITNGPQGITGIDPFRIGNVSFAKTDTFLGLTISGPMKYYWLLLVVLVVVIVINLRLQNSRIGRAWEAVREDETAARAMGRPA